MTMFKNHPSLRAKRSNPTSPRHNQDCHGTTCLAMTMKRILKSEAGYALPLALILLLFGGFFVVPCLNLLYTSLNANIMVDERDLELYAADAGVDHALWRFEHDATFTPPAQGSPDQWQLTDTVNDRTVDATISNEGGNVYKITSTAEGTTIECNISLLALFSWLFDSAITSPTEVTLKPGSEVDGPITCPLEEGQVWPTAEQLSDYYWEDVKDLTPVSDPHTIDISSGTEASPYPIGPLYAPGNLTVWGSGVARLDGTVYVGGNLEVKPDSTINLNGQTIFAEGNIVLKPGCTISGSGCIIAVGDVDFQPNTSSAAKLIGVDDKAIDTSAPENTFVSSQFTAESDGTVTTFNVECSGSGNIEVAMYTADGAEGAPNTLLNALNDSQPAVTGWNSINFPATDITAGTDYWLAANSDANIIGMYEQASVNNYKSATYSTFTFPNPAGTGFTPQTTDQYAFACYSSGFPAGFVFVMSIEGTATIKPNGDLYGAVAGYAEVELKPGATLELPEDLPDDGLNFPGGDDDSSEGGMTIDTYTIE